MRPPTERVESRIVAKAPLLLVTLGGGARHVRQRTSDGLTYDGPDMAGSFTFLPAGCVRDLQIRDVAWHWAIVAFPEGTSHLSRRSFHERRDSFLRELLGGMRAAAAGETPDTIYMETASLMAAYHLRLRYFSTSPRQPGAARLSRGQMLVLEEFVTEHLGEPLRIADLAGLLGMSAGHFHRRFVATNGVTPLRWIVEKRVAAAKPLLADPELSVLEAALAVGVTSPSRFAQQFRQVTGLSPRDYRKAFRDD